MFVSIFADECIAALQTCWCLCNMLVPLQPAEAAEGIFHIE